MDLKDRYTKGYIAGIAAGIPTLIFNGITHVAWGAIMYHHFASAVIYGHEPQSLVQVLFSILTELIFVGTLGAIFAYFIRNVSSRNLLLKGWSYGVFIWFIIYAVTSTFNIGGLADIEHKTAVSNFLGASIWGLSLAYALKWLDVRVQHQ